MEDDPQLRPSGPMTKKRLVELLDQHGDALEVWHWNPEWCSMYAVTAIERLGNKLILHCGPNPDFKDKKRVVDPSNN